MSLSQSSLHEGLASHLHYVLDEVVLPELGEPKKGKIREIYDLNDKLLMIASDRVSAFDRILNSLIPFKGQILNQLSIWNFNQSKDIVPNALILPQPDENVIIQKKVKPFPVEFIVRGYLWGSMAAAYEKGERSTCGVEYPDGMLRYQKFDSPIFTPTTKAPKGQHDENISMETVIELIGKDNAEKARDFAFSLFERGTELAKRGNLILVDTKYEFGVDEQGDILVIDEVNTPDSSRYCDISEWETKFARIQSIFADSKFANVSELVKAHPETKIKEYSKQFVRDILVEKGYKDGSPPPKLTDDQIVECTMRYIQVYERVTGEKWCLPSATDSPTKRLLNNLKKNDLIKGCCAIVLAGSASDEQHYMKLKKKITTYDIPCVVRICSAHKQPKKLMETLKHYNCSAEPILFVCCAGGTDALSGTVSYHSLFPAVSCPPDGMNSSCLHNPPGSSNAFIMNAENVAKFAMQVFSTANDCYVKKLQHSINSKIRALVEADAKLSSTSFE